MGACLNFEGLKGLRHPEEQAAPRSVLGCADSDARAIADLIHLVQQIDDVEARRQAGQPLVFEVVLSENQGNFKFGQTRLPDEAKMKIDEMVQQLKQDPKNVFIEIEGHTDNVGDKLTNEKIGLERAEAVQRYLYEQYQIPLHKMNVISYGEDKPAAPNKTKAGRAQNRRVVIKVLV